MPMSRRTAEGRDCGTHRSVHCRHCDHHTKLMTRRVLEERHVNVRSHSIRALAGMVSD